MTPSTFTFAPGLNLRVIDKDGEPWFVAIDVCRSLGMAGNANQWTKFLDRDEVAVAYRGECPSLPNRGAQILSESGLYSLVLRSRKPEARRFAKWVTSEVLPAIRKTGSIVRLCRTASRSQGDDMSSKHTEADEALKRAVSTSEACTRSGTVALLASLALLGLVPSWNLASSERDAYRYYTYRLRLEVAVDALLVSPSWKSYLEDNPEAEDQPLSELATANYESPTRKWRAAHGAGASPSLAIAGAAASTGTTNGARVPPKALATSAPSHSPKRPEGGSRQPAALAAPTLTIASPITEVGPIVDNIVALDDPVLLAAAQKGSNSRMLSIAKWQTKFYGLITSGMSRSAPGGLAIQPAEPASASGSVPPLGRATVLANLRMRDAIELAQYQMPELSRPAIRDSAGGYEADLNNLNALPKTLDGATSALELLLVAVMTYFAVFTQHATAGRGFRAPGTLFGAFTATSTARSIFTALLIVPPLAAVFVAAFGKTWWLWALAVLNSVPAFWTMYLLYRGGFFDPPSTARPPRKVRRPASRA